MVSLVNRYYKELSGFSETPLQDARALLSCVLKSDPLLTWRSLSVEEEEKMSLLIEKRKKGVPIAYIIGEKEFMSLSFFVNEHTLIPRPDTETIVETLIDIYKGKSPKILDLCCGSGCIGISLAHFLPYASVTMADISQEALTVAQKNTLRNGLTDRVSLTELDVLHDDIDDKYDLIVSNPPYIASNIVPTLEVSGYEPHLALDGGDDGLLFYRTIIPKAYDALNIGGILSFEIGFDQGISVTKLMEEYFSEVSLKQDLSGNDRMVYAKK